MSLFCKIIIFDKNTTVIIHWFTYDTIVIPPVNFAVYNPCQSSPCLHNGLCVDSSNSRSKGIILIEHTDYKCFCPQGYRGKNCEGNHSNSHWLTIVSHIVCEWCKVKQNQYATTSTLLRNEIETCRF